MGDMGELFNALKDDGKRKRANNRKTSPELLSANGIEYENKNMGAHLVVRHYGKTVDFWPGTGRWIDRNGRRGFGVRKLISYVTTNT